MEAVLVLTERPSMEPVDVREDEWAATRHHKDGAIIVLCSGYEIHVAESRAQIRAAILATYEGPEMAST